MIVPAALFEQAAFIINDYFEDINEDQLCG
jgi:hypothetical protein